MAQLSNLEREVAEKEESVSAQGKVYEEMDVRHQKQLEEIRGAGHQTLAIMVEEYKVRKTKGPLDQTNKKSSVTFMMCFFFSTNGKITLKCRKGSTDNE